MKVSKDVKKFWISYEFWKIFGQPLKYEFLLKFSENFKRNWQGMVQTSFGMWLCSLCQIWGHLNNARLINCPQVANWGWQTTWSTHRTSPALRERIVRERFFFMCLSFFMDTAWYKYAKIKWRFRKILSNFELVMNFGRFLVNH